MGIPNIPVLIKSGQRDALDRKKPKDNKEPGKREKSKKIISPVSGYQRGETDLIRRGRLRQRNVEKKQVPTA